MFNFPKINFSYRQYFSFIIATLGIWLCLINVANAHHPMGGTTPSNFFEGLMSGFGHPIIGLDHCTFVVASGLIAAGEMANLIIPISFIIATIIGTIIHLNSFDLAIVEMIISASVIISGIVLIIKNNPLFVNNKIKLGLAIFAGFVGIFHGYAYGEAIIGAETTPLFAYLLGFTVIQLVIAFLAFLIADLIGKKFAHQIKLITRFLGIAIATIGGVYFFN